MERNQLQSMHSVIKKQIQEREFDVLYFKDLCNFYWKHSDKQNPETSCAFSALNHYRNKYRSAKEGLKTLQGLSLALKREIRTARRNKK